MKIKIKSVRKTELLDVTPQVKAAAKELFKDESGALLCYVPHTTAAITINENADPDVANDIEAFLKAYLPADLKFRHMEGNSDAHVISTLVGVSVLIHVEKGNLKLGRWQGIFFVEADGPRERIIELVKLRS